MGSKSSGTGRGSSGGGSGGGGGSSSGRSGVDKASGIAISGGADAKRVLGALDAMPGAARGNLVPIADLRSKLGMGREQFDSAVNSLRKDRIITAAPFEGRHENMPKSWLDSGIGGGLTHKGGTERMMHYVNRLDYDD